MDAIKPTPRLLRFGAFQVDVRAGELTNQGKRIRLQEQPFLLLVRLLETPGEVVTRNELRSRLWPRTVVDFDHGLNKAISKIRDALVIRRIIRASFSEPLALTDKETVISLSVEFIDAMVGAPTRTSVELRLSEEFAESSVKTYRAFCTCNFSGLMMLAP
jgi:hypothetical protein